MMRFFEFPLYAIFVINRTNFFKWVNNLIFNFNLKPIVENLFEI